MSLATVRTAISTALDGITGLRSTVYLSDLVNPPAGGGFAMVEFGDIDYDLTFGSSKAAYPLHVIVFAQREQVEASQKFFDTLRDPNASTSVAAVLQADAGVNAVVDYLRIDKALRPTITTVGVVDYLTLEFQGEVCL